MTTDRDPLGIEDDEVAPDGIRWAGEYLRSDRSWLLLGSTRDALSDNEERAKSAKRPNRRADPHPDYKNRPWNDWLNRAKAGTLASTEAAVEHVKRGGLVGLVPGVFMAWPSSMWTRATPRTWNAGILRLPRRTHAGAPTSSTLLPTSRSATRNGKPKAAQAKSGAATGTWSSGTPWLCGTHCGSWPRTGRRSTRSRCKFSPSTVVPRKQRWTTGARIRRTGLGRPQSNTSNHQGAPYHP